MKVEPLAWDSDFFGLRIGRAFLSSEEEGLSLAIQRKNLEKDYDLLYVFTSHGMRFPDDKAKLVDEKVVYSLSKVVSSEANPSVELWDANKGVTDELLHLALVSGKYSRFKLDDSLPSGSYERLYSRWIEQSVNHAIATEVFCYMVNKIPKGLVTLDRKSGVGTIGLVAIHEELQGRGIGSALIRHVIRYAQAGQCIKLSVATQHDNIPACRLYEKNGFETESVTDVWHWWL